MKWFSAFPTLELQAIYAGKFNPIMKDAAKMQLIADRVAPIWGKYAPNELLVSKVGYVYDREEGTTLGRIDAQLNFYQFSADMI